MSKEQKLKINHYNSVTSNVSVDSCPAGLGCSSVCIIHDMTADTFSPNLAYFWHLWFNYGICTCDKGQRCPRGPKRMQMRTMSGRYWSATPSESTVSSEANSKVQMGPWLGCMQELMEDSFTHFSWCCESLLIFSVAAAKYVSFCDFFRRFSGNFGMKKMRFFPGRIMRWLSCWEGS